MKFVGFVFKEIPCSPSTRLYRCFDDVDLREKLLNKSDRLEWLEIQEFQKSQRITTQIRKLEWKKIHRKNYNSNCQTRERLERITIYILKKITNGRTWEWAREGIGQSRIQNRAGLTEIAKWLSDHITLQIPSVALGTSESLKCIAAITSILGMLCYDNLIFQKWVRRKAYLLRTSKAYSLAGKCYGGKWSVEALPDIERDLWVFSDRGATWFSLVTEKLLYFN